MRRRVLVSSVVLASVLAVAPVAGAQPDVVEYDDPEERAAAWALLRQPVVFELDRAALTPLSREIVAEQARTLAQNPELSLAVGVAVGLPAVGEEERARELFLARAEALVEAYAAAGVGPGQVRVLPVPALVDPQEVPKEDSASIAAPPETAVVLGAEGPLAAGVRQELYTVRSWRGAAVYLIPRQIYNRDEAIACAPPVVARVGFVGADGTMRGRASPKAAVFVARRAADTSLGFHDIGDPAAVDLTTALDVCD